ncbi:MAG: serine O-acetyltransferase [Cyanobacteriota bacterium]|nr:serine O-acetyltransferase [Cyanobacteriota bacterium]
MLQPITLPKNQGTSPTEVANTSKERRIWEAFMPKKTSRSPGAFRPPSSSSSEFTGSPCVAPKTLAWALKALWHDFQIVFERDPAAHSWLEVLCCYPGLHALAIHRISHWMYHRNFPFLPRFLSHLGRFFTGIEIHPGATFGKGVFIDHGMGVVVGETAIVGDYCLIYQNATLGGTGKESGKRHPTLGNNVVVGAGAKVLGNITIGHHVRVGAGSIVLNEVPDDCTVVGIPGRVISRSNRDCPLEHNKLPDVEAKLIRTLLDRIEQLEQQVQQIRNYEVGIRN